MSGSVADYYSSYDERGRLAGEFSLERLRSQEIIARYLPTRSCRILDIGGAAGLYSFWLAGLGHEVSLVDLTPKHIEQALEANAGAAHKLAEARLGDACELDFPDEAFDIVLLMGPLYHLIERPMRLRAIREAGRVARKGGVLVAAAISRFASLLDGYKYGLVGDPLFRGIVDADLETGNHLNPTDNPGYFTTSRFHLPGELRSELSETGLEVEALLAVEGFANCLPALESLQDPGYLEYLLEKLRETEAEESMLGASSHLLAIARKPLGMDASFGAAGSP